jgi:hypothetical protein
MDVVHRNDVNLGAKSSTSAGHGGSKANNDEATDDTDYSNVPGCPTTDTLRNNGGPIRIHLRLPLAGKLGWSALHCTMVNACEQIGR